MVVATSPRVNSRPRVAVNERGDALVVWTSGHRLMSARRIGPSGSWRISVVVGRAAAGSCDACVVSLSPDGRAAVLWTRVPQVEGAPLARAAFARRNGPWRVLPPIRTGGEPGAALDARGGAAIAWVEPTGAPPVTWSVCCVPGRVRVAVARPNDGRWTDARTLAAPADVTLSVAAAITPNGTVGVAWSAGEQLRVATGRVRSTGWSETAGPLLTSPSVQALAIDDLEGTQIVVWDELHWPHASVHASIRRAGHWSPAEELGSIEAAAEEPVHIDDAAVWLSATRAVVLWWSNQGLGMEGSGTLVLDGLSGRWSDAGSNRRSVPPLLGVAPSTRAIQVGFFPYRVRDLAPSG